ncbi:hypothetical protein V1460_25755 [Streptomyces sp. SCSIO 30461]|uniref:hypothetical protein n=1 Tax=Streptomyces sp. SCSIO 30461 TaxID=3118085 RepID=UPI0030D0950C
MVMETHAPTEPRDPQAMLDPGLLNGPDAADNARALDRTMSVGSFRTRDSAIPLRPVLLPAAQYTELVTTALHAADLLTRVCRTRASSPEELARLVDFVRPSVSLWSTSPRQTRWSTAMARPDLVLSGGVPKLLELNVNSALGGLHQVPRMDRAYASRLDIRAAAARFPFSCLNMGTVLAALLTRVGRSIGVERPRVAILGFDHPEDRNGQEAAYTDVIDTLRLHGLPAVYAQPQDLRLVHGRTLVHGTRVDILVRDFVTADAADAGIDLAPLRAVVEQDAAVVLAPETGAPYASKRVLSWLTEDAPFMSPADRQFVERHVPPTHVVRPGVLGDTPDAVLRHLWEHQPRLVLKGNQGHSAERVAVGRECPEDRWRELTREAVARGDSVVQELVPTDTVHVPMYDPGSGATALVRSKAVYGPMLLDGRCGGILTRHMDAEWGDVVRTEGGGTMNSTMAWEAADSDGPAEGVR